MKIWELLYEASKEDKANLANPEGEDGEVEIYQNLGTFIGLSVDRLSSTKITNFCEDFGIENPTPQDELHATLIATKDFLKGFVPEGVMEEPYMISGFELEMWKGHEGTNVLVAKFNSEEVEERHQAIRREFPDMELKYDEFRPHITISYEPNAESELDLERLTYSFNEYVDWLALNEEYVEPLNVDGDDS